MKATGKKSKYSERAHYKNVKKKISKLKGTVQYKSDRFATDGYVSSPLSLPHRVRAYKEAKERVNTVDAQANRMLNEFKKERFEQRKARRAARKKQTSR